MHNSATVHRMRMQSSALDSSRSQLCNDTSTGVVRHQITKRWRLQKVVSYDVLHHILAVRMHAAVRAEGLLAPSRARFSVDKRCRLCGGPWIVAQLPTASGNTVLQPS